MKLSILSGAILAAAFVGLSGPASAQVSPERIFVERARRSLSGPASAQVSPEAIIGARQAGFDLMSGTAGQMKAAVAAGTSVKIFSDSADAMVKWAKAIPAMFPPGTDKGTKALPEIWSDSAGFAKAAGELQAKATVLAAAAKADDVAAFKTAFGDTAAACGGCHKTYRAK